MIYYLDEIITDKTTYLHFIDNLDIVQRRVNAKRQVFLDEKKARKDAIKEMEQYR